MEWTHIYPLNDLIDHNTEPKGTDNFICKCNPKIDVEYQIITHNSLDRREVYQKEK